MRNNKWIYHHFQGIQISDEFGAEIGLRVSSGTTLKFYRDCKCYRDFTVDADGVRGEEVTSGAPRYVGNTFLRPLTNSDILDSSFDPASSYDDDSFRVAICLSNVEPDTETDATSSIPSILFYIESTDTIDTSYTTVDDTNCLSVLINETTKVVTKNLNTGSENEQNYSLFYMTGNPGDYGISNYYISGQIFREFILSTNIPIFDTQEHAEAYLRNPSQTVGLLNESQEDPEEAYDEQFDFWYLKNKWGHNTRNVDSSNNTAKNYRFYPKRRGICFIKHTPTSAEPYDRILYNYSDYEAYFAAWGETADEDFEPNTGTITTHFLTKSISFGPNDYYTKFDFETNIPLWNNQEDADDYYNGLKDITEADNYAYIARQDNAILNPNLPGTDIDELTELGTNGMRYSYGNRLYEISNIELSNLMTELFQPATVQSVIDGNKLFGSNTMEAVSGVIYIPLTSLDAVCELGSLANVKIGSWESQQAQGRRIIKNEGTIDCGSFFYNRTYNDYRDYEPYNLLFYNGPFVGCHQLTVSKYIDRTVSCRYNIDITTGGIVCSLYADNILVDVFPGTCGASRPISATDNNAYINNVVSAITGASSQASGAIEGITNTVDVVGKAASVGAVTAGAAAFGGTLVAGGIGASGIYTAYQIKNAVDNPPQMHRGSLAGNLAYNLNTKPTFLFYSKRTIRPENELAVVGYPSGHGGTIGTFNGFLSCAAVKLANFTGSKAEESELFEILKGGIYI